MRFGNWMLAAIVAPLVAAPGAAFADVLQVNGAGHEWVAGGPGTRGAASRPAESSAVAGAVAHPRSVTQIADAAGPVQWRRRIAELAVKYDLSPALLEAVVWQESRWNPAAVSPAGARGLAQLMPGTARMMGVDPNDPHANLEGGARYLRLQLDAFDGDIERALAAYNAGPGRVVRAGGIPRIRETQNYVAAILARLSQPVRE